MSSPAAPVSTGAGTENLLREIAFADWIFGPFAGIRSAAVIGAQSAARSFEIFLWGANHGLTA